ncbi:hypothetical protein OIU84_004766 [Salix udensis]|uniref:Ribosomal eL28/Mak16 domain-containing protein n=1 Tax=Salix udensis TaxID=889485 RepID=A0AAD6P4L5_9ROSI|nr:hypothetical protein OIU84_004766 [Salix udensis]
MIKRPSRVKIQTTNYLRPKNPRGKKKRGFGMATVPGQLIWEMVKKNNCFLVKQFGRGTASLRFSKESNNLYNLNSYKHSGLANKKTVTIQAADKDQAVVLATSKTKKQNKPASLYHKSVMKKEFSRMAKAVENQVIISFIILLLFMVVNNFSCSKSFAYTLMTSSFVSIFLNG